MFDQELEDAIRHEPKTDLNFYNISNNYSTIEPWGKSTEQRMQVDLSPIKKKQSFIKSRPFYDQAKNNLLKYEKKSKSQLYKYQAPYSTITFNIVSQNKQTTIRSKMINTMATLKHKKKSSFSEQKAIKYLQCNTLEAEINQMKGFKSTTAYTNLLKQKQKQNNKMKQILFRPRQQKDRGQSLQEHHKSFLSTFTIPQIEEDKTGEIKMKIYDYLRRPRKSCYVGVRKLFNSTAVQ